MPKVELKDLDPCVGNAKLPCGLVRDPMIRGYDGKWRCVDCNRLHTELVFQEAGTAPPNPGEAQKNLAAASRLAGEFSRKVEAAERLRKETGRAAAPERVAPDDRKKTTMTPETEQARREQILKKYGARR